MMRAWTPQAERCRPKMVIERISPPSWSGLWREMDHHLPRGWSLQIHSRAQPTISPRYGASAWAHQWRRATSRYDQRASAKPSGRSSRKLSPTRQIRCESQWQCPPRGSQPWTVWAWSGAEGELIIQPQIRKSWDSMENANKKRK